MREPKPKQQTFALAPAHFGAQQIMRFPEVCRDHNDCDDMREIRESCGIQWAAHFREGDSRWNEMCKPRIMDVGYRLLDQVAEDSEDWGASLLKAV